jgi:hypothetical protein
MPLPWPETVRHRRADEERLRLAAVEQSGESIVITDTEEELSIQTKPFKNRRLGLQDVLGEFLRFLHGRREDEEVKEDSGDRQPR